MKALITPTLFGIVNLKFFPNPPVFVEDTVNTSPAAYPVPPIATVAATPTPPFTVKFTVAPVPLPNSETRGIPEYTTEVEANPLPALVIVRLLPIPIAPRKVFKFALKLGLFCWYIVTPPANPVCSVALKLLANPTTAL